MPPRRPSLPIVERVPVEAGDRRVAPDDLGVAPGCRHTASPVEQAIVNERIVLTTIWLLSAMAPVSSEVIKCVVRLEASTASLLFHSKCISARTCHFRPAPHTLKNDRHHVPRQQEPRPSRTSHHTIRLTRDISRSRGPRPRPEARNWRSLRCPAPLYHTSGRYSHEYAGTPNASFPALGRTC